MKKISQRQSNFELLRIVAMFLVLIVHADFFTFGEPTIERYQINPEFTIGQYFFESLSIGCVNIFVMISGWFGIRPKIQSFIKFIFQCLFFLVGIYIFCLLIGLSDYTLKGYIKGILGCLMLLKWNWFIKAYVGLYILSPVLNSYVEQVDKKHYLYCLITFFLFQTCYSWLNGAAEFFLDGYSTMSFVGLYLLARYVKMYPCRLTSFDKKYDLLIFCFIVLLLTGLAYFFMNMAVNIHPAFQNITGRLFKYVNPLVVLLSLYLVLFFSKLQFNNNFINWIGTSSFAVFLLHTNPNLCKPYFCKHVVMIFENNSGFLGIFNVMIYLVVVFILAILMDQLRLFLWNFLVTIYQKKSL